MKRNWKAFIVIILCLIAIVLIEFLMLYGISGLFITLFLIFSIFIFCLIIYIFNKLAKKRNIELIDHREKLKDEYWREILSDYSPGSLCYIDNYNIDINVIVATLLSLEFKRKITINNEIKVIDNETSNLSITESYILNMIRDGKVKLKNLIVFRKECIREATEKKLITDKNTKMDFSMKNFLIISSFVLFILLLEKLFKFDAEIFMRILGFVLAMIIVYLVSAYFSSKDLMAKKRTELGEEINRKLEGLKIYLKSFSDMELKNKDELNIWDQYLIYSVMFNQNKKINKNLEKYIEIEFHE